MKAKGYSTIVLCKGDNECTITVSFRLKSTDGIETIHERNIYTSFKFFLNILNDQWYMKLRL